MKRLVIILVLVLLLAGGGAGAWWFMNREPEEAGAEPEVEPAPSSQFVKIDPITLPMIRQNQVTRFVTFVITLEMPVADGALQVSLVKRQLMDALFTELHSLLAMKLVHKQGLDSPLVKQRIMTVSQRVLGKDKVTAVLIQGVSQQRPKG